MIYLVPRHSPDWTNEAAFWAQLPEKMKGRVELWNETFRVPYWVFRQRLGELARQNWASLPGVTVVRCEEVPDGELVLPCDDDDWYSPRVGPTLEGARQAKIALYRWPGRFLEVPRDLRERLGTLRRRWLPRTPPARRYYCATNGYAVTKGALDPRALQSHVFAGRWSTAHRTLTRELEHPLSVMNRSLASQTQYNRGRRISRAELIARYRRYLHLYQTPPAAKLSWMTPHVDVMRDLMLELAPDLRRVGLPWKKATKGGLSAR
jgi:hypothetical protein